MILNKHNLTIAKHCGIIPSVVDTSYLKFTPTHTIAANGHYMISVSVLQPGTLPCAYVCPSCAGGCIEMLELFEGEADATLLPLMPADTKGFNESAVIADKPVAFELFTDVSLLRKLLEEMEGFSGPERALRIQFTSQDDPVRMCVKNPQTKQTMQVYLTACKPTVHRKEFEGL